MSTSLRSPTRKVPAVPRATGTGRALADPVTLTDRVALTEGRLADRVALAAGQLADRVALAAGRLADPFTAALATNCVAAGAQAVARAASTMAPSMGSLALAPRITAIPLPFLADTWAEYAL
jgi:hypothetical protein